MRFALFIGLGNTTWDGILGLTRHAEATGWDAACLTDHFMPNTADKVGDHLECISTLSALAVSVPRIRLGSIVLGNTYRHPAVLAKMLALAVKWELRADNPARGIERAPEERRERFLTPAEIARLGDVLAEHLERTSANAVRLLLLTGSRRGEVLGATWDQFDLSAGTWTKPAATTKQAKLHRVPLSAAARALLSGMRAEADQEDARRAKYGMPAIPFLFPGKETQPLREIKHFWGAVCRKAGITGVRVHDLRHTFASILASSGLSLPIIGALLGHTQASTTNRYSHLLDDPLRAAAERAGAVITGAGSGQDAEVVEIGGRRRA